MGYGTGFLSVVLTNKEFLCSMLHVTSFVAESLYIAGECNGTRILRTQVPDLNVEQGHCTLDSFKERTSKVRKIKCPFFWVFQFCLHANGDSGYGPGISVCHFWCDTFSWWMQQALTFKSTVEPFCYRWYNKKNKGMKLVSYSPEIRKCVFVWNFSVHF